MDVLKGPSNPVSTNPFRAAPDPAKLAEYLDEAPKMEKIIGGGVQPLGHHGVEVFALIGNVSFGLPAVPERSEH